MHGWVWRLRICIDIGYWQVGRKEARPTNRIANARNLRLLILYSTRLTVHFTNLFQWSAIPHSCLYCISWDDSKIFTEAMRMYGKTAYQLPLRYCILASPSCKIQYMQGSSAHASSLAWPDPHLNLVGARTRPVLQSEIWCRDSAVEKRRSLPRPQPPRDSDNRTFPSPGVRFSFA
jgi:hypothetical protein